MNQTGAGLPKTNGEPGKIIHPHQVLFTGKMEQQVPFDLRKELSRAFPIGYAGRLFDAVKQRIQVVVLRIHFRKAEDNSCCWISHEGVYSNNRLVKAKEF